MKEKGSRFLAAQSAVCAVLVAAALLLRLTGGTLFEELQRRFRTAVEDDAFGAAWSEYRAESEKI